MTRRTASSPIGVEADAENLRTLIAVAEAQQPGLPLMNMCTRALDLYEAAKATGEPRMVDQVGRLVAQLVWGIVMGAAGHDPECEAYRRLDA